MSSKIDVEEKNSAPPSDDEKILKHLRRAPIKLDELERILELKKEDLRRQAKIISGKQVRLVLDDELDTFSVGFRPVTRARIKKLLTSFMDGNLVMVLDTKDIGQASFVLTNLSNIQAWEPSKDEAEDRIVISGDANRVTDVAERLRKTAGYLRTPRITADELVTFLLNIASEGWKVGADEEKLHTFVKTRDELAKTNTFVNKLTNTTQLETAWKASGYFWLATDAANRRIEIQKLKSLINQRRNSMNVEQVSDVEREENDAFVVLRRSQDLANLSRDEKLRRLKERELERSVCDRYATLVKTTDAEKRGNFALVSIIFVLSLHPNSLISAIVSDQSIQSIATYTGEGSRLRREFTTFKKEQEKKAMEQRQSCQKKTDTSKCDVDELNGRRAAWPAFIQDIRSKVLQKKVALGVSLKRLEILVICAKIKVLLITIQNRLLSAYSLNNKWGVDLSGTGGGPFTQLRLLISEWHRLSDPDEHKRLGSWGGYWNAEDRSPDDYVRLLSRIFGLRNGRLHMDVKMFSKFSSWKELNELIERDDKKNSPILGFEAQLIQFEDAKFTEEKRVKKLVEEIKSERVEEEKTMKELRFQLELLRQNAAFEITDANLKEYKKLLEKRKELRAEKLRIEFSGGIFDMPETLKRLAELDIEIKVTGRQIKNPAIRDSSVKEMIVERKALYGYQEGGVSDSDVEAVKGVKTKITKLNARMMLEATGDYNGVSDKEMKEKMEKINKLTQEIARLDEIKVDEDGEFNNQDNDLALITTISNLAKLKIELGETSMQRQLIRKKQFERLRQRVRYLESEEDSEKVRMLRMQLDSSQKALDAISRRLADFKIARRAQADDSQYVLSVLPSYQDLTLTKGIFQMPDSGMTIVRTVDLTKIQENDNLSSPDFLMFHFPRDGLKIPTQARSFDDWMRIKTEALETLKTKRIEERKGMMFTRACKLKDRGQGFVEENDCKMIRVPVHDTTLRASGQKVTTKQKNGGDAFDAGNKNLLKVKGVRLDMTYNKTPLRSIPMELRINDDDAPLKLYAVFIRKSKGRSIVYTRCRMNWIRVDNVAGGKISQRRITNLKPTKNKQLTSEELSKLMDEVRPHLADVSNLLFI